LCCFRITGVARLSSELKLSSALKLSPELTLAAVGGCAAPIFDVATKSCECRCCRGCRPCYKNGLGCRAVAAEQNKRKQKDPVFDPLSGKKITIQLAYCYHNLAND
jgi:hypothetical protein